MATRWIEKITGSLEGKRRWWRYKARVKQLPPNYRAAVEAIQRYLMYFVPTDADSVVSEFEDLADLFERAAADGTPIREIVGEDPVEFVETFVQNYTQGGFAPVRERKRLTEAVERAAGERTGEEGT